MGTKKYLILKKWFYFVVRAGTAVVAIAIILCIVLYWKWIVDAPGAHIQKESILKMIAQESQIHYQGYDPTVSLASPPIGSLFSDHHRQYISFGDLPSMWVDAIVSTEDHRFFSHHGISPFGIIRAVQTNILAGRVVSGGSTLTQQTAKNLFQRPDRSFTSKAGEALNALRLEYYYGKEQILEFYANQFHVNANGRGIAIAARYFFNKEVSELTLVECAFIAGMVKGPNLYDPLNKRTEERREKARTRAHVRTKYVLERMFFLGKISSAEFDDAMEIIDDGRLPFRRGVFRFADNVITQEVARRLGEPEFRTILNDVGIDDPSSAGLQIVTTIDESTQKRAIYGLRKHLSELGPKLKGSEKILKFDLSRYISIRLEKPLEPYSFHYAKVVEKNKDGITFDVRGHSCVVDPKSLKKTAKIWGSSVAQLEKYIEKGDVLYLRIDENIRCIISVQHDLEGGVLAVQNGGIVAMVGGTSNKDLNRSLDSERQLGSVWKTLIYAASMHLGWSELDALDNVHNAFYFERGWYFPKAAHRAKDFLSMNWVGTHSENKASVWLMYHLSAQLSVAQLEELAVLVGLGRKMDETDQEYRIRIRDRYGVISTNKDLDQIAFMHAKRDVLSKQEGQMRAPLISLSYGGDAVERRLAKNRSVERVGLEHSWTRLEKRISGCDEAYQKLKDFVFSQDRLHYDFFRLEASKANKLEPQVHSMFWMGDGYIGCGYTHTTKEQLPSLETWTEVPPMRYDGYFPVSVIEELQRKIKKYRILYRDIDGYALERLVHHHDFLFVVHARYIAILAKNMGIEKNLAINMSTPLGVTDITLAESIAMYEGVLTGQRHVTDQHTLFRLIDKIYYTPHPFIEGSGDPVLLYSAKSESQEISHERSGSRVLGILYNVVRYGTGRRAKEGVHGFPVFGKTGTTNRSLNAAFCGVIPASRDGEWSFRDGLFISSYVGFDQPKPMQKGRYGISGASGALPIWLHVAFGAVEAGLLGEKPHSSVWNGFSGFQSVSVSKDNGFPTADGSAQIFSDQDLSGDVVRYFSPVYIDGVGQEDLLHSFQGFADDTGVDILIPKEE